MNYERILFSKPTPNTWFLHCPLIISSLHPILAILRIRRWSKISKRQTSPGKLRLLKIKQEWAQCCAVHPTFQLQQNKRSANKCFNTAYGAWSWTYACSSPLACHHPSSGSSIVNNGYFRAIECQVSSNLVAGLYAFVFFVFHWICFRRLMPFFVLDVLLTRRAKTDTYWTDVSSSYTGDPSF